MCKSKMNDHKSQDNYEAKTLILNDANGNELFCYLEQIVKVEEKEYALLTPVDTPVSLFKINEKEAVSYTHLTLPTKRIV